MLDEEDLKRLAEVRGWLDDKLKELKDEELTYLTLMAMIDEKLKKSSFITAAQLPTETEGVQRALRGAKDNLLLGMAYILNEIATIVPEQRLMLHVETPPFKNYLINKVFEPLKASRVTDGRPFNYMIDTNADGTITKIKVENYGSQEKLNEILTKVTWTFGKMAENMAKGSGPKASLSA